MDDDIVLQAQIRAIHTIIPTLLAGLAANQDDPARFLRDMQAGTIGAAAGVDWGSKYPAETFNHAVLQYIEIWFDAAETRLSLGQGSP